MMLSLTSYLAEHLECSNSMTLHQNTCIRVALKYSMYLSAQFQSPRLIDANLKFNHVIYVCFVVIYSLTIEVIMKCGHGSYGPDCGRVCVIYSESHFTCDSKGFKSCYKGIEHSNIPDDTEDPRYNDTVCYQILM